MITGLKSEEEPVALGVDWCWDMH